MASRTSENGLQNLEGTLAHQKLTFTESGSIQGCLDNGIYQPKIELKQSEMQLIVQFFRAFNDKRQFDSPVSIPYKSIPNVIKGTKELVYSVEDPYIYPAYPPHDSNTHQSPRIRPSYRQFIASKYYTPPVRYPNPYSSPLYYSLDSYIPTQPQQTEPYTYPR
ncbi:MAG: hypothetical protein EZS28_026465 [Streblomastix strix]|uniref:Uncharacterized protein n=1 Tax=Streblomastix strix TaxID=222440 RepID=A0A5J4V6M3_9EUKA|nr:MAG: hypothetical protein EZS28_026465 [Streblomastix strix]